MSISRNFQIAQLLDKDSGTVKASKIDSDQIVTSSLLGTEAASAVTDLYTNLNDLPADATTGTQAYVSSNNGLYVKYSNGWYRVALINNSPYWVAQPDGTYSLNVDGTATTITVNAGDSDGHSITFTATGDSDFNLIASVTKDSDNGRIFTIIPIDSENSTNPTTGSGVLTFKASDGISFASQDSTFSITFSTVVADSAETVLLVKASGSGKAHEGISYQNGSDPTLDIVGFTTTTGTPIASSFSPYREGGYSTYLDGNGDYLTVPHSAAFDFGTGDYTIEFWINTPTPGSTAQSIVGTYNNGGSTGWLIQLADVSSSVNIRLWKGGTNIANQDIGSAFSINTWHHIAVAREGTSLRFFVDGVQQGTDTTNSTSMSYTSDLYIGKLNHPTVPQYTKGYIRDLRIFKGTAIYTSDFTAPTEALTASSGAVGSSFLGCHLPYFADGSQNSASITAYGNTHTEPFGPYDYNPFTIQSDVGSTFLSTAVDGMAETTNHQTISNFGSSDFTIECWYYPTGLVNYQMIYTGRANTSTYGQLIFFVNGTGTLGAYASSTGSTWNIISTAGTTIKVINQTWNHLAFVRNGNTWTVYVNGVGEVVSTNSGTLVANTLLQIGYENNNANSQQSGYISDYRIVKGTAVYTADFTPPTEPLTWVTNTTLQLQNKWDTYVYDAAAAGRVTLLGDAQSTTSQRKFTTSSALVFDGTTDGARFDELTPEYLGGDFTIQFWLYPTTWYNSGTVFGHWVGGQYHHFLIYSHTGTDWKFYASSNGSTWNLASAASVNIARWTNSWKHVAMTYDQSASTVKFWLDGTLASTHTGITGLTSNSYTSSVLSVASDQNGSYVAYAGYVQDVKVNRSVDYTATFTPPTAEFEL